MKNLLWALFFLTSQLLVASDEATTEVGEAAAIEESEEAEGQKSDEKKPVAWLTGPLIAPFGEIVPLGTIELDIYNYLDVNTGLYNKDWGSISTPNFYAVNSWYFLVFGLNPWMDIQVVPQFFYNWTRDQHSAGFGDLQVLLDFQLYPADNDYWFPGIKFSVKEIFPTGKCNHLDPDKLFTDHTGQGAFASDLNLVLYKVYHLSGMHFFSFTLSAEYTIPYAVHVRGFNAYGGGYGTKGIVLPGNTFEGVLSFEYSFNRNWACALDNVWIHVDKSTFSGKRGTDETGNPAVVRVPSSESLSFAPALEYNFSDKMGISGGCWFTALGRNTPIFRDAVISIYFIW